MKITTVVGARPQFIKAAVVLKVFFSGNDQMHPAQNVKNTQSRCDPLCSHSRDCGADDSHMENTDHHDVQTDVHER